MSTESTENYLPKDLSNLSFQEIFELKNKIGEKGYNALFSGNQIKQKAERTFQRENKNRPREMSSKMKHQFLQTQHRKKKTTGTERKPIDPRFSHSYGEFNREAFEENYKFLNRIKKKEKRALMKELVNPEIDEDERKNVKLLLQRMDNQNKEKTKLKKKDELKHVERQYQINELKEGRQPEYHKKSEKKLLDLVSKFEELKEKGGLVKYIKRRRKKLTQKDYRTFDFLNSFERSGVGNRAN